MLYSQFHHHPLEDVEPVLDARDVVAIQETVFATRLRSQDRAVSRRARRGDAAAPFAQDRLLAPRNVGAIPGFAGACVRSRATHRASDRSARSRRRECESTRRRSAARLSAFLRDGVPFSFRSAAATNPGAFRSPRTQATAWSFSGRGSTSKGFRDPGRREGNSGSRARASSRARHQGQIFGYPERRRRP